MSRFVQNMPTRQVKPAKDEAPTPKFGGKGGKTDYSELSASKKIPTKDGYK